MDDNTNKHKVSFSNDASVAQSPPPTLPTSKATGPKSSESSHEPQETSQPPPTSTVQQNEPQETKSDPSTVVTTSGGPTSGRKNTKVIATIFSIVLLIAGVAAGTLLIRRQQEIRERAAQGRECQQNEDCILLDEPGNAGSFNAPRQINYIFITAKEFHRFDTTSTDGCYDVSIDSSNLSWRKIGEGPDCKDVSNVQVWLGGDGPQPTPSATPSPAPTSTPTPTLPPEATPTPTSSPTPTPTLPPEISASCHEVVAYDTSWNLLTTNDLSSLKEGDVVRFAVSGTATSGTFDSARFTINGIQRTAVTSQKPGSSEFYDEYTIPVGTQTFSVSAQIHHTELGWF